MRIKSLLNVVASLALLSPALFANTPDWAREAASATLPTYDAETNAVVLLESDRITITSADTFIQHHRRVVKLLRPEGRDEAELAVFLQKGEQLLSLHAWSTDSSHREFELKEKDFIERGYSLGFDLYNDVRLRTATAPAANPGTVIAFEYEAKRHNWINQIDWYLQETIPIRK